MRLKPVEIGLLIGGSRRVKTERPAALKNISTGAIRTLISLWKSFRLNRKNKVLSDEFRNIKFKVLTTEKEGRRDYEAGSEPRHQ